MGKVPSGGRMYRFIKSIGSSFVEIAYIYPCKNSYYQTSDAGNKSNASCSISSVLKVLIHHHEAIAIGEIGNCPDEKPNQCDEWHNVEYDSLAFVLHDDVVGDEEQVERDRNPEQKQKYADANSNSSTIHPKLRNVYPSAAPAILAMKLTKFTTIIRMWLTFSKVALLLCTSGVYSGS